MMIFSTIIPFRGCVVRPQFLTSAMQIAVKFFARAKDLTGTGDLSLSLSEGCTVGQAKAALVSLYPNLRIVMSTLLVAVNGEYAGDATPLTEACELACFPPVSGG